MLKKLISVFFIIVFSLGSGAGQLIHAAFHKHEIIPVQQTNTSAISLQHTYCSALQLMLPEFSGSGILSVPFKTTEQAVFFYNIEISIPLTYSFKTSDRAPPFLA